MTPSKKDHWENVFATKQENEVSWFQEKPQTSINFFTENKIPKNAKIIDVGGGDSYLIDNLLQLGYTNLSVLDISSNAINKIKNRLGTNSEKVHFIVSDILEFQPQATFDVWHDRASFHFLTSDNDKDRYQNVVANSLSNSGLLFLGTFSEIGPLKCSGLEIAQYSKPKLENIFGAQFTTITSWTEDHTTPFNTVQNFIFCTFKKN